MKVKLDDAVLDKITKKQLKKWRKMAETHNEPHPDDIAFWEGMRASCDWILKNNWPSGS